MKVLIDTNVVLDVLINNAVFFAHSKKIFDFAEQKRITGYISASAITDIFFIAQRKLGKKAIKEAIKKVLKVFYPATVTDNNIDNSYEQASAGCIIMAREYREKIARAINNGSNPILYVTAY